MLLPGGFSYGDALGAGGRLALELRTWFADELASFVEAGKPMLGICNGFQVLVKAGLLPGPAGARPTVTLTENGRGRVRMPVGDAAGRRRRVVELAGGRLAAAVVRCPIAHGEGRVAVDRRRRRLQRSTAPDRSRFATMHTGAAAHRRRRSGRPGASIRPTPTAASTTSPASATTSGSSSV